MGLRLNSGLKVTVRLMLRFGIRVRAAVRFKLRFRIFTITGSMLAAHVIVYKYLRSPSLC